MTEQPSQSESNEANSSLKSRIETRIDGIDDRLDQLLLPNDGIETSSAERLQLALHELEFIIYELLEEIENSDDDNLKRRGTREVLEYAMQRRDAMMARLEK